MSVERSKVMAAFAAIYLIWGSTYLFMRFAVETVPPLGVSAIRFFIAGALLYLWARWRSAPDPRPVPWGGHAVVGVLLTTGNLGVAYGVQRIPSGVASLLVGMTPCLMVLLEWGGRRERAPGTGVVVGLLLGVAGTILLVGPRSFGGAAIDPVGAGMVLAGTVFWSTGSIYSKTLVRHSAPARTSGVQLLWGGGIICLVGLPLGQLSGLSWGTVSMRSLLSMAYLVLFGSVIAYSAYMYLLGVTSAARVSTYAFVNPVVAVVIGAIFAREPLTPRVLGAGALIVAAVALITLYGGVRPRVVAALSRRAAVREAP